MNPKVTIIMATYNRGHLIEETLESIFNQSFRNWECLIIDDGSTDNTKEVLQPYLEKENRFSYHERDNNHKKGLPGCRNQGLELAKGDYIIFFDDDDIVHPDNLKISIGTIKLQDVDYLRYLREVFSGQFSENFDGFDRSGNFITANLDINDLENIITGKLPFNSCQILWRKKCFENNHFNEELMYAEEWECYSRILSSGVKGISIDKVLFFGRKHQHSNTGEFWNNDPIRRTSKITAVKLVIDNLSKKRLLSPNLVHYFIQTGFFLKEFSIIDHTLKGSKGNFFTKLKYNIGYRFYPIIRPVFKLKGKLKKMF
jgi:glycosyltransferase involved in cell wall biosynthesis